MDTTVSVIVPAYNVEDYLPRLVRTACWLKHSGISELIPVDDGSTDTTGAICDRYRGDRRPCARPAPDKCRVSAARNRALEIASGAFITFVDADDTTDPTYPGAAVYRHAGHRRGYCLGELAGHKWQERL